MKRLAVVLFCLLFCFSLSFASTYDSDLASGYKLYKAGDYSEALKYYKAAYKIKPTKKVQDFIDYLENKIENPSSDNESSDGVHWSPQQHLITINPVALIVGMFDLHYEMAMGPSNGLGINAGFMDYNIAGWSFTGANVGVEYNWYFQHHALNGWYGGPLVNLEYAGVSYKFSEYTYGDITGTQNATASASAIGVQIGVHGGYRWIWDGFTLDLSLGAGYTLAGSVTVNETINGQNYGSVTAPFGGFGALFGCNIGWAF